MFLLFLPKSSMARTQSWNQETEVRENQRKESLYIHWGKKLNFSFHKFFFFFFINKLLIFSSSLYAVVTHQSSHLTSITAAHFGSMINQITVISKEYSEISLSAKVFLKLSLFLSFFPCSSQIFTYFLYLAGFQFDYVFDWTILKYQQSQLTAPPSRGLVSPAVGTNAALPPGLTSIDRYAGELYRGRLKL